MKNVSISNNIVQRLMSANAKRQRITCFIVLPVIAALVGSSEAWAFGPRPRFQMPVPCGQTWAASTYEEHWNYHQDAIDLAQWAVNTNISEGEFALASAAGTVLEATTANGGANKVVLDHGNGWLTNYWHLESVPPLSVGQQVAQGQVIGRISNSGTIDMHLHYTQFADGEPVRVYFNGQAIDTHKGNLDSWGTFGKANAEKLTSLNCPGNTFMKFNNNGQIYQFLYKPGTGDVKILRVNAHGSGVTNVTSGTWTKGWTHFIPFTLWGEGEQQHMFSYKSSTGRVRFARIDDTGTTELSDETWDRGWTHFIPFTRTDDPAFVPDDPYFIAYNSINGHVSIDRINSQGNGAIGVLNMIWSKGWTQLVPFVMNGVQYILLYKGGTGQVEIDTITGFGDNVSITEVWSDTWSTDWTHFVPLEHNGATHLLGYKAATGQVSFTKLNSGGLGVQVLGGGTWANTWTTFSPLLIDGQAHVLAYKTGTGESKMLKLNATGTDVTTLWTGTWTTGWK